jgi:hypothetical protein
LSESVSYVLGGVIDELLEFFGNGDQKILFIKGRGHECVKDDIVGNAKGYEKW